MTADPELSSPQIPPAMGINQAQQSVAENIFSTIIFIFKLGLVMETHGHQPSILSKRLCVSRSRGSL
jgi:hypothetical protein